MPDGIVSLFMSFFFFQQGMSWLVVSAHSAHNIVQSGRAFLLYGTAWKKERTAQYVSEAVKSGFRFIDTACQPKHYK